MEHETENPLKILLVDTPDERNWTEEFDKTPYGWYTTSNPRNAVEFCTNMEKKGYHVHLALVNIAITFPRSNLPVGGWVMQALARRGVRYIGGMYIRSTCELSLGMAVDWILDPESNAPTIVQHGESDIALWSGEKREWGKMIKFLEARTWEDL